MQAYNYTVKDEKGKTLKGKIEARDERQALNTLRTRNLTVISLQQTRDSKGLFGNMSQRVGRDELVQFTQQIATMLNSGLPLTDALDLLRVQAKAGLQKVLNDIMGDIQGGLSFADALKKHPAIFSAVYVSLVRAGEASGRLDEILNRLAENEEKAREFRAKVKGAMIYPVIIVTAMIGVMAVLMIFVVPQLTEIYDSFDAKLPIQTQILIVISNVLRLFWWAVILAAVMGFLVLRNWQHTPAGKRKLDELVLKMPLVGPLRIQVIMAEFASTLGLLVSAGISILDGLHIVSETVGNAVFGDAIRTVAKSVEKGMPLAATLAQQQVFPPIMSQMVSVGEETGKLDEILVKVARYFESLVEHKIKNLTTAIEPIIMVVLGVMVAFIVFAIITPLYQITELF